MEIHAAMDPEQGFDLKLKLTPDDFFSPEDDEGLTNKQVEAWNKEEWWFVYAEVVASRCDVELGAAGYGGIAYGYFTQTDEQDNVTGTVDLDAKSIMAYVGAELAGEAISNAEEKLNELMKTMEEN